MTRVGFLFLGIGLLVAIIVLLLALLMSNRVYNPIGEMVRTASEEGLPSEAMETAGEYGAVQHRPDLSDDGAETEPYQPAQRAGGSCRVSNQQRENRKIAGVGGRDLRQAGCPDSCRGHAPQ